MTSQRHAVKEQEAMSQVVAQEISAAYQENFSLWEWLRNSKVVKLPSLNTSKNWLAKTLGNMIELLSWCCSEQETGLSDLERALPAWISLWFCKSKLSSISSYLQWVGEKVFRNIWFPLKFLAENNLMTYFPLVDILITTAHSVLCIIFNNFNFK